MQTNTIASQFDVVEEEEDEECVPIIPLDELELDSVSSAPSHVTPKASHSASTVKPQHAADCDPDTGLQIPIVKHACFDKVNHCRDGDDEQYDDDEQDDDEDHDDEDDVVQYDDVDDDEDRDDAQNDEQCDCDDMISYISSL